mmetsp:Transcript_37315/g.60673  ORF Transcript_37315/g.60673 Transcript_37315/m.60673 type:complete len:441 (+) Transcript_37315:173-1495(+)
MRLWILALLVASSGRCSGKSIALPLKGGIAKLGEYYVEMEIGTPGQIVRVQADTGSSSFIVTSNQGSLVVRDEERARVYRANESATSTDVSCASDLCGTNTCNSRTCGADVCADENNACCSANVPDACGFFLEYGGDTNYHVTASGVMTQDTLKLGELTLENITFYRTLNETGPWPSKVDGVFGLGYPRLNCNPTCTEPVYDIILSALGNNSMDNHIFSMCMGDSSGMLVLGSDGSDHDLFKGSLHYVPVLSSGLFGAYYTVGISNILVGLEGIAPAASTVPHQAILDSGTTLLLLEQSVWDGMVKHFQSRLCRLPGVCAAKSIFKPGVCLVSIPKGFPTISINLVGGIRLILPPNLYFIKYKTADGEIAYCFGIQPAGHERTVLGDTLLRGFHVVFDLPKQRVGFAEPNTEVCGSALAFSNQASKIKKEPNFFFRNFHL